MFCSTGLIFVFSAPFLLPRVPMSLSEGEFFSTGSKKLPLENGLSLQLAPTYFFDCGNEVAESRGVECVFHGCRGGYTAPIAPFKILGVQIRTTVQQYQIIRQFLYSFEITDICLLYTSDAADD